MKRFAILCALFALIGCTDTSKRTPAPSHRAGDVAAIPAARAAPAQRFVPTGNNPAIALDTQTGRLCRTIVPTTGSHDKYAGLPLCTSTKAVPPTPVPFAWDKGVQNAPLEVSCSLTKNLLRFYPVNSLGKMSVTPSCTIKNRTSKDVALVRSTNYDAFFREPDGKTTRRSHVNLASSKTVVPAHRQIQGGLFLGFNCSTKESPQACLKSWLGGSREFVLTADGRAKARVTMNRDVK